MTLLVQVPGSATLDLEHLVLDVNGTLTDRGDLLPGVEERLEKLRAVLDVHLLSADTFGTLGHIAEKLNAAAERVSSGMEKRALLEELGPTRCVVVGNGANDVAALQASGLGIAVVGPEGASSAAIAAADVVCGSILVALDLITDEQALRATLRR